MRYAAVVLVSFVLFASSAVSQQTPQSATASIEGIVTRRGYGCAGCRRAGHADGVEPARRRPCWEEQIPRRFWRRRRRNLWHKRHPRRFLRSTRTAKASSYSRTLPEGSYNIVAVANGFVRHQYGQRSVNGQGTPFVLAANQNMKDMALRLTPAGTVSGRILDENGQPALGIPVQILRACIQRHRAESIRLSVPLPRMIAASTGYLAFHRDGTT